MEWKIYADMNFSDLWNQEKGGSKNNHEKICNK
jgi:hypothetical protein